MIERFKRVVRRHWPRLRLRTILLLTFTFVAALPGFGALFLRVYENALVRQTEAALIAEGAALAAAAATAWPSNGRPVAPSAAAGTPTVDLRLAAILPDRPAPRPAAAVRDARVLAWRDRVVPTLDLAGRATGTDVLLLDARGRLLTGRDGGAGFAGLVEVRSALRGRDATVLRRNRAFRPTPGVEWLSRAADLRLHHARPIVAGGRIVGVVLLAHAPSALFAGLHADRGKIALGIALIFATLVVLSGLLSRGIVRPVEALGAATRAVAGGGVGTPMPDPPNTAAIEIQALFRDVASMANAIERRSRYLRDFAHAVSHEFKTPLAGIGGAVELLHDHPDMAAADRERFLGNIAADAARLAQLVSRLLDLARADMAEVQADVATDLAEVTRCVADAHRGHGLSVALRWPAALPPAQVPRAAVEATLNALFDNSRQAGAAAICITAHAADGSIVLTIADDGPGIPPGDRDRVFEPFFTSRRASGGSGLGLAIARSLIEAHRGTIALDADATAGATFHLTLPTRHAG